MVDGARVERRGGKHSGLPSAGNTRVFLSFFNISIPHSPRREVRDDLKAARINQAQGSETTLQTEFRDFRDVKRCDMNWVSGFYLKTPPMLMQDEPLPAPAQIRSKKKLTNKKLQRKPPVHPRLSPYNRTTRPRIPTAAAATATPAGFPAPLVFEAVTCGVTGGVTDLVGDPAVAVSEVTEAVTVPFADRVSAVPLPDHDDAVRFADPITKPELAVALGADVVSATVVLDDDDDDDITVGAAW